MRSAKWEMRNRECEIRNVKCEMRNASYETGNGKCRMWSEMGNAKWEIQMWSKKWEERWNDTWKMREMSGLRNMDYEMKNIK